ncbi:MAG: T9SS type A sorting domain-containing protein [Bacteroidetes bacterium]|nr:T9SS type A sorting domain-containing protein [Bacteroidota bacterium]
MKRNRLVLAGIGIAATALAVLTTYSFRKDNGSLYRPSHEFEVGNSDGDAQDANGAIKWMFDIKKNPATGQLDYQAMIDVADRANQAITASRTGGPQATASTASWTELGPDNIGGRTRAILFDNLDPTHQHMWAGGVGGGLFESNDGANNWHRCAPFFNLSGVVISITTIAQGPTGILYVGTGEDNFYGAYATGSGGLLGGGIYSSSDDGLTWTHLASTNVTPVNSSSSAWAAVDKIVVDPNDALHIFVGMNKGFRYSIDGGVTFTQPASTAQNIPCTDVDLGAAGTVIATCNKKPYVSTDNGLTFTNHGTTAFGWLTTSLVRTEIAVAPSDPNYVYAFCASSSNGGLAGMLVSINGGMNWTIVTGAGNAQFDPFNQSQGQYDNVVAVDPNNKMRAIFGGVELWEWNMTSTSPIAGQWSRIALEFPDSPFNPWYVHSDKHSIVFHPSAAGEFFIGTDGGIFRTINNGSTYTQMNKGYDVTQCYSVAPDMLDGTRTMAISGNQDNGTTYIDGSGYPDPMWASSINGGDGAECETSFLNGYACFSTIYYGSLARSNNRGQSSASFYSSKITSQSGFGTASFASFITPIRLWESTNDLLSGDTIRVINRTNLNSSTITDGVAATYTGTVSIPINAIPAGVLDTNTAMVKITGLDSATTTNGVLSGTATGFIHGDGSYSVTFNTVPPANKVIKIYYDGIFTAGTTFFVNSNVQGKVISHLSALQVNPGDTVKIQDVIQSRFAVGFTSDHGIWITRRPIDFSVSPEWLKIGGTHSTPNSYAGECEKLAWSVDGNSLFASTGSGTLYRFDNVSQALDSATGYVDNGSAANPGCKVKCHLIGNFSGRYICGLDVDPNNPGRVIVSLGNYGMTQYVYLSTTADTATSTANAGWVDKTANLDNIGGAPVYTICFDKYTANRVLAGTEHGMFETTNITAASPTWATAMTGLDNVAVFMIRQQRWDPWLVPNSGCFYIGTHGRGIWRDDSSWQGPMNGINDPQPIPGNNSTSHNKDLKVFPNPVGDEAFVNVNIPLNGNVILQVYDLNGNLISSEEHDDMMAGITNIRFETSEMAKGTYLVTIIENSRRVGTGRFIKMN